jgi:hypothetical protein
MSVRTDFSRFDGLKDHERAANYHRFGEKPNPTSVNKPHWRHIKLEQARREGPICTRCFMVQPLNGDHECDA